MEDFWAGALWALKIWLYLIISLIMIPAMFGFSLGISETYMTVLVKTLEVLWGWLLLFGCLMLSLLFCLVKQLLDTNVLLFCSGPLWRCRRRKQMSGCLKRPHLMVSRMRSGAALWQTGVSITTLLRNTSFRHILYYMSQPAAAEFLHQVGLTDVPVRFSTTAGFLCHSPCQLYTHLYSFITQWFTVAVVAPVIAQLLESLCHTGCFSLSSYTIKRDRVSKTESLLSPKCARV